MQWIGTYKWYIIIAIVTAAVVISYGLGYGHGKDRERIASIKAVEAQKEASEKDCQAKQLITTGVDSGLQKNLSDINGKLSSSVMLPSICIMPTASNTPSDNATSGTKLTRQNGISAIWFRQYAAEAETYRVKLMACQQLLIKERE